MNIEQTVDLLERVYQSHALAPMVREAALNAADLIRILRAELRLDWADDIKHAQSVAQRLGERA